LEHKALQSRLQKEEEARAELEKKVTDSSLLNIAQLVLSAEKYKELCGIPSANSMGAKATKVTDMCKKGQRDLGRIVGPVIDAILFMAKAGESDPAGVLDAVLARRDSKQTAIGAALLSKIEEKNKAERQDTLEVLAASYRCHINAGNDKQTAKQVLSIAVSIPGTTDAEIMRVFSSPKRPFAVGDSVFTMERRH
jgi:hypothetical protein